MKRAVTALAAVFTLGAAPVTAPAFDLVIRNAEIYDGSGGAPFKGEVAVNADRIAYVGPHAPGPGAREIDAGGKALAPGFINMLSWANETLIADGRGLSDLKQGITLEVMGEGNSMGPINADMRAKAQNRQADIRYDVDWTTLGDYLSGMEKRGVSMNVASFIGAETTRVNVLGEDDVDPTPAQLEIGRASCRERVS
jgi:N-acyl-D-amino-acid deacylase